MNRREQVRAFTLVELLVVISIIALLIGIAMPAFRGARTAAKVVACKATITSIGSSLETFRSEQALGGAFPPSTSDADGSPGAGYGQIDNPYGSSDGSYVNVSGASLLVYALAGPDNRGTAGFTSGAVPWSERMGSASNSGDFYDRYSSSPRYGPYASGELMESIMPMADYVQKQVVGMIKKGVVQYTPLWPAPDLGSVSSTGDIPADARQRFFTDAYKRPILYYRARKSARSMVTNPSGAIGVYDHRDNVLLTGGIDRAGASWDPTVFSSKSPNGLAATLYEGNANYLEQWSAQDSSTWHFDNFIVDPGSLTSVVGSARPVNASTYLLISAGPDGAYGTKDDVKNWGK